MARHLALVLIVVVALSGCAELQQMQAEFVNPGSAKMTDRALSPAQRQDPELEGAMIQALANAGWKEEVRGVSITAPDWTIERHPVSGVITHRVISAEVVTHLSGKTGCRLFSLSFQQPYDGASYTTTALNGTGNSWVVDCDAAVATDAP